MTWGNFYNFADLSSVKDTNTSIQKNPYIPFQTLLLLTPCVDMLTNIFARILKYFFSHIYYFVARRMIWPARCTAVWTLVVALCRTRSPSCSRGSCRPTSSTSPGNIFTLIIKYFYSRTQIFFLTLKYFCSHDIILLPCRISPGGGGGSSLSASVIELKPVSGAGGSGLGACPDMVPSLAADIGSVSPGPGPGNRKYFHSVKYFKIYINIRRQHLEPP